MIELYRSEDCPACADIEATLQELVVAHRVIIVAKGQKPADLSPDISLPVIKENGQLICDAAGVAVYLRELERFVINWRRFQSDSCYINDDGQIC
jgi:glutaredoxin